jgi:hypothetical protein
MQLGPASYSSLFSVPLTSNESGLFFMSGTRLIFVIREDISYKDGDLRSYAVDSIFRELNKGMPRTYQPTIMSWNKTPCDTHRDALVQLLSPHKDVRPESHQNGARNTDPTSRVLKSDPPGWKPDISVLEIHKNEKSATIECWEKEDRTIVTEVVPLRDEANYKFCKIAEGIVKLL